PEIAFQIAVPLVQLADVPLTEAREVHAAAAQTVVPPDGDRVALHQFQEALENRLFQGISCRVAVGVGPHERSSMEWITEIQIARRQIAALPPRERPDR